MIFVSNLRVLRGYILLTFPFPANIHLSARTVGLGPFLGFKLGNGAEHIAQFFEAVIAGVKIRGAVVDFVAHAAQVGPAGFFSHVVNGLPQQFEEFAVYLKVFFGFGGWFGIFVIYFFLIVP